MPSGVTLTPDQRQQLINQGIPASAIDAAISLANSQALSTVTSMGTNGVTNNNYVTYDPAALNKPGTRGNVGWIAPEAVKSDPTGFTQAGGYMGGNSLNAQIDSNFYNRFPTQSFQTSLNTGNQDDNPFNPAKKQLIETAPNTNNTNANSSTSAGLNTLRNLNNRKPGLANSWGGWNNSSGGNASTGQGSNFTFFSRFE